MRTLRLQSSTPMRVVDQWRRTSARTRANIAFLGKSKWRDCMLATAPAFVTLGTDSQERRRLAEFLAL